MDEISLPSRDNGMDINYEGGCLCHSTTYIAKGNPINPHLCSCTMCQKSSGAPTVAWVEFPLTHFKWTGKEPGLYRSSEKTLRCFCKICGGLLGTLNDGYDNVCLTIATLNDPGLIEPNPEKHSYQESAPAWWLPRVLAARLPTENITQFLRWITSLQAIAQNGLTFAVSPFDEERYNAVTSIAAEMASNCNDYTHDEFIKIFFEDNRYKTPNLDVRAAVFRNGQILLVQENNGLWTLPGGWADVNESPSSNVEREVLEEAGLVVKATKLISLFDKLKHKHPPEWPHAYKCFFLCDIVSGELQTSIETQAVDFFPLNDLPPLCPNRITVEQLECCFRHFATKNLPTDFD